jgi:hypothetical protein
MFKEVLMSTPVRNARNVAAALGVLIALAGSVAAPSQALSVSKAEPLGPCSVRAVLRGDDVASFHADGIVFCPTARWSNVEVRLKLDGYEADFRTSYMWSGQNWLKTGWWKSRASCGRWQAVTVARVSGVGAGFAATPQTYFCRA